MNAESLEGVPDGHFDVTFIRWGLMFMNAPVAALAGARRAMVPGGVLVAAVWAEPERVPWFSLPRRVLQKYRPVPPIDRAAPGTFHYADTERLRADLEQAGFELKHVEEADLPVMEANTTSEVIAWVRAFGLTRLLNDLPEVEQQSWEEDFAAEAEALRDGSNIQLGGVTRIVVATSVGGRPL